MKSAVVDTFNVFFVCFGKSDVCEISGREEEEEDKNCSDIYVCYSFSNNIIIIFSHTGVFCGRVWQCLCVSSLFQAGVKYDPEHQTCGKQTVNTTDNTVTI